MHVVKDTALAEQYRKGEYTPLTLDEYVDAVVRFLERLPPDLIVQRITGEAPRRLTVAPAWSVNKLAVANAIERELEQVRVLRCAEIGRETIVLDFGPTRGSLLDDAQVREALGEQGEAQLVEAALLRGWLDG